MPHDSKGRLVKDGDLVTLKARISGLSKGEEACNCTFNIIVPDGINEDYKPSFAGNTRLGAMLDPPVKGGLHPSISAVLQFFAYSHLPLPLQEASRPFCALAYAIAEGSSNAETTVALRKLLEAKDAAVRAVLFKA